MPDATIAPLVAENGARWARLLPRSLAARVITFSTIWAIVALVVIATVVSSLFREASERGFDSLLSANLFNLIASVGASPDGQLTGNPELGDPRYAAANSGWYWTVEPAAAGLSGELRSLSMLAPVKSPAVGSVPFDARFQRRYLASGPDDQNLAVLEAEIVLGEPTQVARFRVMGNLDDLDAEIWAFNRQLYLYLLLFGLGMIAINAVAILLGLRPLGRVREALSKVRQGTAQRLDGIFPAEIEPLANETNALIENNRRILERSRTQVGNLAHSLKTPLAVLINEGRAIGGAKGRLIDEQAAAMKQQLDHYLQRARIAAQRESVVFRTPVAPVLQRMVRVMAKLNPEIDVSLMTPTAEVIFAGEREDLEEIAGNLIENAVKWGKRKVKVSLAVSHEAGAPADGEVFILTVEDDGPGIPEEKAREALKRGRRLDETKPGTGLGLSIVSDLVAEYDGTLRLDRSTLGGLRAAVQLRRAP
ncbi:MAG: ATP-binding protein [Mesorhizobium sp.]|nr:ATP-binding protein [Mesorhizobium sp.]